MGIHLVIYSEKYAGVAQDFYAFLPKCGRKGIAFCVNTVADLAAVCATFVRSYPAGFDLIINIFSDYGIHNDSPYIIMDKVLTHKQLHRLYEKTNGESVCMSIDGDMVQGYASEPPTRVDFYRVQKILEVWPISKNREPSPVGYAAYLTTHGDHNDILKANTTLIRQRVKGQRRLYV